MSVAGFDTIEEKFLQQAGVERSTMMGFPSLRSHEEFFASLEPQTGYREWVKVPDFAEQRWTALVAEARRLVAS